MRDGETKATEQQDPLCALADFDVRVVWINDLDDEVLVLDEHRLVLADADLTRLDVAGRLIELLLDERRAS